MGTTKKLSIATTSVVLILGLLLSSRVEAITFTKIADSNGPFSEVGGDPSFSPSINDAGTVVFGARLDERTDLSTTYDGIFTSNGETITTIADLNGPFKDLQRRPEINNAGVVAFSALLDTDNSGVFSNNSGTITTIADSSGSLSVSRGGGWFPSINDVGTVAFGAYPDTGGFGIFTANGDELTTITLTSTPGSGAFGSFNINNDGTVVFLSRSIEGVESLSTSKNGIISTIADSNGPFSFFLDASLNDLGTVAFSALLDTGGGGVFTSNGETVTTIVDSSSGFSFVSTTSINNNGTVAFLGSVDGENRGIFIGTDPVADKVIAIGDSLFGSEVLQLSFSPNGLNNSNQLAFGAYFSDGYSAIVRVELESESPNCRL
jgi:hypothetical protein